MSGVHPAVGAASALASVAALTALYRAGFGSDSQLFGPFPSHGASDEPLVALTFDDGPNEPWTGRLLDLLGEREVPGTFFQVGRCAERHPEVTRRVVDEGHVLGNHSLSHSFGRYLTEPRQEAEIRGGQQVLQAVAGVTPLLYRPPWLCHWPWVLRGVARSGSSVVSGTFGSLVEVAQPSADRIAAASAGRAAPGSVLILHDGREARGGNRAASVAAVGPLVDRLRARGYRFTTVDRLLGLRAYA
ncbi:Peptidoglycan/xylan/chitin deacetylase, PgdA/CDA1 family [Friedmanniella luteola]|uniref:Peptidoglycan/xylan/chitin deacetylase, PgdA/CDA1 family n=1 Tax=Friedmanniella luteola TaxID=546871 RepID=A0A1H1UVA5_9ACTN|nr:polysaccharide deacetylase family protein [Friedmanniella luteola]SDS76427.1 Peptidoglycan/xylan/chitin deacetylase, PgdA/CDA1 family [Friedmanniella luteola]